MYPVSEDYKNKIQQVDRLFNLDIEIHHPDGILELNEDDIEQGSFKYVDSTQNGDEFDVGGVVASHLEFSVFRNEEIDDLQLTGSEINPVVGLQLREPIDAHFLQPSQPSKMVGEEFDELGEEIPLGRFIIDEVIKNRNKLTIKAIDYMLKLQEPYRKSTLTYPTTLWDIYEDVCDVCGVPMGSSTFMNDDYPVYAPPSGEYTFRDIISFVAELSGNFAKINRDGELELRWYEEVDLKYTPDIRYDLDIEEYEVGITGIGCKLEDEVTGAKQTFIVGDEKYIIDLSKNPLFQVNHQNIMEGILNKVSQVKFRPHKSEVWSNPAIQSGDIFEVEDIDGNEFSTIVTNIEFVYGGKQIISGEGKSELTQDYKGSTSNDLQIQIDQNKENIDDKLEDMEDFMQDQLSGLGELAYKDMVEKAMLGETIIQGGHIRTELISFDNAVGTNVYLTGTINAEYGRIGDFVIVGGDLVGYVNSRERVRLSQSQIKFSNQYGDGVGYITVSGNSLIFDKAQNGLIGLTLDSTHGQEKVILSNEGQYNFSEFILYNGNADINADYITITGTSNIKGQLIVNQAANFLANTHVNYLIVPRITTTNNTLEITSNGNIDLKPNSNIYCYSNLLPSGSVNLGSTSYSWNNVYTNNISGRGSSLELSTNSGNVNLRPNNHVYVESNLLPWSNNNHYVGSSTYRWANIYLNSQPNVSSDIRQKEFIQNIPKKLACRLVQVKPKMFKQGNVWHFGYLAQDMERELYKFAIEEVGYENAKDYVKEFAVLHKDESYLSLLYGEIAVLKDQLYIDKITDLENRILVLEGK